MGKQESRDPIPSLSLALTISEIVEQVFFLLRTLDYRISKETSNSSMVNVSMTAIISYPKNIPMLSWNLRAIPAHISSIGYRLCQIINCPYTGPVCWDFRSTPSRWCWKNSSIHGSIHTVQSCFIMFFSFYVFLCISTKKEHLNSKVWSNKLFLHIRLIKNRKHFQRN